MKAMLLTSPKTLKLVDLPMPEVGPGDLLFRVRACGICRSAVHDYDGSTGRRIPPIVMGHEAAGVVEAVGNTPAVRAAALGLRKRGVPTQIGNMAPQVEVPLQAVVTHELSLLGSCASSGEYPAFLELMARGSIDVAPFLNAASPLEEGPRRFDRLHRREAGLIKVVCNLDATSASAAWRGRAAARSPSKSPEKLR